MFFEAENMGNPDFMDFCKTKTDEKVESEAQTGGNGLDCRRLLYCIYVILCVYCKIHIFLSMISTHFFHGFDEDCGFFTWVEDGLNIRRRWLMGPRLG